MRRGVGIGAVQQRAAVQQSYTAVGEDLAAVELEHVQQAVQKFNTGLYEFALKNRKYINKNPTFRSQFNYLCQRLHIDPLQTQKSMFNSLLGYGEFYYTLAVQVLDCCIASRDVNGGLITVDELLKLVRQRRSQRPVRPATPNGTAKSQGDSNSSDSEINEDDILSAIEKIQVLGNGFRVLDLPVNAARSTTTRKMILSVPTELNTDHITLVQLAEANNSYVTAELIVMKLGWTHERINSVLNRVLSDGMVWMDDQHTDAQGRRDTAYYVTSLFSARQNKR